MEWEKLSEKLPEKGKNIWLFGVDLNGAERFDIGSNDKTYGVLSDYGPPMKVTHWAYCEKPEIKQHLTQIEVKNEQPKELNQCGCRCFDNAVLCHEWHDGKCKSFP
jgi:hypothetical protein